MGEGTHVGRFGELPGKIGHYRLIRELGRGGMGSVYEAEQDKPRRIVALKVIRPGLMSRDLIRRFELETNVLGRLQHVGIAQIYEAGTADAGHGPQPFFAMELITGARSITEFTREQKLGTRARLELVAKVCDAVHHAHQKGVIHRDIKPGNILVDKSGQPKILDFGVAKATESDIQVTTMHTDVGQLIGTLPYMSPEQVAADPLELDTRSDVYALGVLTYEMLTGKLPYDVSKKVIHEAARVIREQEPTKLSVVSKVYRGDIETIVAKALEKDKARRYQSAADLAADLRRYLNSEPIVARPASTIYQLKKFAARNRAFVGGVVVVFVVLIAGVATSTWLAIQASRQRERAETNFRAALDVVDKYLVQVGESPDLKAKGLEELRRRLFLTAKDFYATFVQQNADDPKRRYELAIAHLRVSAIEREMGDLKSAESSASESLAILESIVAADPADESAARDMVNLYDTLGLAYADSSQFDKAEAAYKKGLARCQELPVAFREAPGMLAILGDIQDNLGSLYLRLGRLADSAAAHKAGIAFRRNARTSLPESEDVRFGIIASSANMAANLAMSGNAAAGEPYLLEAISIADELVTSFPGIPKYVNAQAAALNNLGGIYTLTDRLNDAEPMHRKSFALCEQLVREHPTVTEYRLRLASSTTNLGELEIRDSRPEEGLIWLDKSVTLLATILEKEPRESTARYYLSYTEAWRARAFDAMGKPADALAAWDRAIELDPKNDRALHVGRAGALIRLGEALVDANQFADAEQRLLAANAELQTPGPGVEEAATKLAVLFARLYDGWAMSEPDKGYTAKAAEWRARSRQP